jgi:hypothetical protein
MYNHSRQNAAEMLEKYVTIACILTGLLPPWSCVRCNKRHSP